MISTDEVSKLFGQFGKILNVSVWAETTSARIVYEEKESALEASKADGEEFKLLRIVYHQSKEVKEVVKTDGSNKVLESEEAK